MKRINLFGILLFSILWRQSFCQTDKQQIDSLDIKIGQMLMIGIQGKHLSDETKLVKAIKNHRIGGVLIYEKSITKGAAKQNLLKLVDGLQKNAPIPLLVSIDQEGGSVNRLKTKYGFPPMVSARYLGNLNNLDTTKHYADVTATALSELKINVNYAPVLDLHNDINPILGKIGRCYSSDPQVIVKHASVVIDSHRNKGVKTVMKHFPGHGNSRADSHLGVVDVTKYWKEEELTPYVELIGKGLCDAIMTAHIVNKNLDESRLPATLSKTIIQGLLRDSLHFDGLVISDDMQMKAISSNYGFEKSIKMAILAGVDVLMFSNNIPNINKENVLADEVCMIIKKMVLDGEIPKARIEESFKRIMAFKEGL